MFKKNARGFTFVEFMIVASIIGIIASIAIPVYFSHKENERSLPAEGIPPRINCTFLGSGVYECKIDNGVVCYALYGNALSCLPPSK